jgi:hypothetical protein
MIWKILPIQFPFGERHLLFLFSYDCQYLIVFASFLAYDYEL